MMVSDAEAAAGARQDLREIHAFLRRGEFDRADALLADVSKILPDEPETLRLRGLLHHLRGRLDEALAVLRGAHLRWPDNAAILNNLGGALRDAGDADGAIAALRKSCEIDPQAAAGWYNLGVLLASHGLADEAVAAFARALECNPDHVAAQLGHADLLARLDRSAQAAAQYRATLLHDPRIVRAWIGLANVAGAALSEAELAALSELPARSDLNDNDRDAVTFALGNALDARADFDAAFAAFSTANSARRQRLSWNGEEFSRRVDSIVDAFATTPAGDIDATRGSDIVLLVGLPGAGAERIAAALAAHADVSVGIGAPELASVIQEESTRRGELFPNWVAAATEQDWQRLGRRYLERSARWRRPDAIYVDPALPNWPFLGALFAMLPGARVINSRGDALETCWACYRRAFPRTGEAYSYDFADLARHWQDHERMMLFWHARHAQGIYQQDTEGLIADPVAALRDLLAFCDLPFEKACVKKAGTIGSGAPARAYGHLLDPLRRLLDPFARGLR
ncbi:MAG: tetratricopeptide repeat protein [Dokdonella sp.]